VNGSEILYEGKESQFAFVAEVGMHYELQVRAANKNGLSRPSAPQSVYIAPPIVVKEVGLMGVVELQVKPKKEQDPASRMKKFADSGNKAVEEVLERKKRKGLLRRLWNEYSVIVMVIAIVVGIIVLTKSTM
jgi:hypothetical protein